MGLHQRIRDRLTATGKTARRASLDAGLNGDTIGKILSKSEQSPTLATVDKMARGLDTTPQWLAYGLAGGADIVCAGLSADRSSLTVNIELLKQALLFILLHEGVPDERAALLADILPEALSGPPIDAVSREPFQSFRVHFQLGSHRSGSPIQR